MTPAQLMAQLTLFLSDLLGTYTAKDVPGGPPAIYLGDPPSNYNADGLEVIVVREPDQANTPLYAGEFNLAETNIVHLNSHGPTEAARAVRRIVSHYPGATVTVVPRNEALGILDRRTVYIPK